MRLPNNGYHVLLTQNDHYNNQFLKGVDSYNYKRYTRCLYKPNGTLQLFELNSFNRNTYGLKVYHHLLFCYLKIIKKIFTYIHIRK